MSMNNIPQGVQDILVEECLLKRKIENDIMKVFRSFGYGEIITPTYEYYDVFKGTSNVFNDEMLLKFFDEEGKILALRPDLTTPIARVCATKLGGETLPIRLCYTGNAYRFIQGNFGPKQREFTQSGIELIGAGGAKADAEVIACTIYALLEAGLEDFQIELGHSAFFEGIIEKGDFTKGQIDELKDMIDKKYQFGIMEFIEKNEIAGESREILSKITTLFGDVDIVHEVLNYDINQRSKEALLYLLEVYNLLKDYCLDKYISFDLGLVQNIDYYTGIIFKGFARGFGFPICGGGRYDNLIKKFGNDRPATGVAIGIDRVMSAIFSKKEALPKLNVDALVFAESDSYKTAFEVCRILRRDNLVIKMDITSNSIEEAKEYAKKCGIGGIFYCRNKDEIVAIDLVNNTQQATNINSLKE